MAKTSMSCSRAVEALASLAAHKPQFTADEIEELLRAGLAVEIDPDVVATMEWLRPIVQEHAKTELGDPLAAANLRQTLDEIDGRLKRDWYRFTTSDEKIGAQERARTQIRRALSVLEDKLAADAIRTVQATLRLAPQGRGFFACTELGDELYAITVKGVQVQNQIAVRLDRYGAAPLAGFLKTYDKVTGKMQAFGAEITTLSKNIGYVKKNPHQVVIGLAKSGVPTQEALGTYRAALQKSQPDVAVTGTRNAAAFGSADAALQRLRQAQSALQKAGFARTPVMEGAAKTLLPFEPLADGAQRFKELYKLVEQARLGSGDLLFKITARLMPCQATPADLVARTQQVHALLRQHRSAVDRNDTSNLIAAALAGMVPSDDHLPELVQRFRAIETELVKQKVSFPQAADDDALECVGCPGSPAEVAGTVRTLLDQLAPNREVQRADVAIAVAFAKRFAY